jgi:hypothetical protein
MIDRQHDRIVFGCDACGRLSEGASNGFVGFWLQAKREGWRARKIGKDWYQFCGKPCEFKLADAQIRRRH